MLLLICNSVICIIIFILFPEKSIPLTLRLVITFLLVIFHVTVRKPFHDFPHLQRCPRLLVLRVTLFALRSTPGFPAPLQSSLPFVIGSNPSFTASFVTVCSGFQPRFYRFPPVQSSLLQGGASSAQHPSQLRSNPAVHSTFSRLSSLNPPNLDNLPFCNHGYLWRLSVDRAGI